jgi:hypothetical protein
MVRTASLVLDQNDGAKALVVGRSMANGGGVDGTVTRIQLYPSGAVLVTVTKRRRNGEEVTSTDKYIVLRGDFEVEVLT